MRASACVPDSPIGEPAVTARERCARSSSRRVATHDRSHARRDVIASTPNKHAPQTVSHEGTKATKQNESLFGGAERRCSARGVCQKGFTAETQRPQSSARGVCQKGFTAEIQRPQSRGNWGDAHAIVRTGEAQKPFCSAPSASLRLIRAASLRLIRAGTRRAPAHAQHRHRRSTGPRAAPAHAKHRNAIRAEPGPTFCLVALVVSWLSSEARSSRPPDTQHRNAIQAEPETTFCLVALVVSWLSSEARSRRPPDTCHTWTLDRRAHG